MLPGHHGYYYYYYYLFLSSYLLLFFWDNCNLVLDNFIMNYFRSVESSMEDSNDSNVFQVEFI